jgi:uncharacterized membrane protein
MATRQTGGKSGKRGTATAGRKPGSGASPLAKPSRGAPARKPASGSPAGGSAGKAAARTSAAAAANGKPARTSAAKAGQATPAAEAIPDRRGLDALAESWQGLLRWSGGGVAFWTLVVSVLGLADASYLTYQHFSESTTFAGCSENGAVNCVAVTTSQWSHLGPFPVSVLGLAFFAFMVVVNSRWGWKAPWAAVHWVRLGSVVVGIVFVLYLIWAELFRINAICLYCTGVHILTFILFALIIGRAAYSGVGPAQQSQAQK